MIPKKMVDRYAHQSGVKDQLVAEREVVLTYALHAMREANVLDLLAFKGGTCLRKIIFGSTGRFSVRSLIRSTAKFPRRSSRSGTPLGVPAHDKPLRFDPSLRSTGIPDEVARRDSTRSTIGIES